MSHQPVLRRGHTWAKAGRKWGGGHLEVEGVLSVPWHQLEEEEGVNQRGRKWTCRGCVSKAGYRECGVSWFRVWGADLVQNVSWGAGVRNRAGIGPVSRPLP